MGGHEGRHIRSKEESCVVKQSERDGDYGTGEEEEIMREEGRQGSSMEKRGRWRLEGRVGGKGRRERRKKGER